MEIRKVKIKDIAKIKSLANSLVVKSGDEDKKTGFYEYSLTEEQYKKRSQSDLFFACLNNSNLEGFCMAYDYEFVRKLVEQEPKLKEDAILKYITKLPEKYAYIDQFAVRIPGTYQGNKAVYNLCSELIKRSKYLNYLVGAIPHKPWQNKLSKDFFIKRGAKLIGEVKGKNKIIFGIYKFELL
jgi:hypothetical protein